MRFRAFISFFTQSDGTIGLFYVPFKSDVFSQSLVLFRSLVDTASYLRGQPPPKTIWGMNGCFQAKRF